jgi:hypothetical protein
MSNRILICLARNWIAEINHARNKFAPAERAIDFIEVLLTEGILSGDDFGMKPSGRPP